MKVLKFGGTSVGTVKSLTNVKKIIESCDERQIVVVSALGGITDLLIKTARESILGGSEYMEGYREIIRRHYDVIDGMISEDKRVTVRENTDILLNELGDIFKGLSLIKDLPSRTLDIVVSYGERLSSYIISNMIEGAELCNSLDFIRTGRQWGKHILDNDATCRLIHSRFDNMMSKVAICPGFISKDGRGDITNLGRGGSDYTAAILAATLGASTLEIWTDVDGFMTADPRIISDAFVIDELSFIEAMELCNFGAKVIYPPTIYPVFHRNIPIYIKNTFNPEFHGTRISDEAKPATTRNLKGISSISDTSLITLKATHQDNLHAYEGRILNSLSRNGISLLLVSRENNGGEIMFAVAGAEAAKAKSIIHDEFTAELETEDIAMSDIIDNLSTIAIVGENIRKDENLAERISGMLTNNVRLLAISRGTSETTISFVVDMNDRVKAMNMLHGKLFL